MATITEDYVSFEIAKLLKEKGFDENTEHKIWYVIKQFSTGCHWNSCTYKVGDITREYNNNCCIPMPTLQMAMKWLREVHKVHIIAEPCLGEGSEHNLSFNRWFWTILKEEGEYKPIRKIDEFTTYEQACEAAIKYCLENLI